MPETARNQPLPDTIREDFLRDGYVCLRRFCTPAEVSEICENVERYVHDVVPHLPPEHVFYETRGDLATLKQLQRMHEHDTYFGKWMTQGRFPELAAAVLADSVRPQNMQFFNKPPGIGQATPPHQDGYYFMLTPNEAVTMWMALEPVDEETGCVRYVRGSHLLGMRAHDTTGTLGFSQGIPDYPCPNDRDHEVAFPAEPGDLLVHHALTIHRADGNRSPRRSRRALGLIYYGAQARQDEQAHAAYQRRLSERLRDEGKI